MRAFVVDEPRTVALRALNYAPAVERIRRAGSSSAIPLRTLAKGFGQAYGTVFTRLDCSREHGVQLLSQTDTFAAEPEGRTIRRDSMPNPQAHEIRRWQVLVSGAGQMGEGNLFGRSILADLRLEGGHVGPDTFVIEFHEPGSDLNLWSYAFLNTTVGISGIQSSAYGTSIPHLRADLLGDLPIPKPTASIANRVVPLIRHAVEQRESYLRNLKAARELLKSTPEFEEALEMCAARRRRTTIWGGPWPTLCAWTYASTGGALVQLREYWSGRLGDFVQEDGIFNGFRFARVSCQPPNGIDLMSQSDALMVRPVPRRISMPAVPKERLFARSGTIMVGAQGTLGEGEIFGRAMLVTQPLSKVAFTQHLLRIVPQAGFAEALYAVLTTTVGFRLLRSTAVGTKLLSMRTDLLAQLPVPDLTSILAVQVGDKVKSAFEAKDDADRAESEAIRIIEDEVLPQWLG